MNTTPKPCRRPTDIDAHVGMRIRAARLMSSMSQEMLAERLGLTFQQVQKYEKGSNRISAGRLFDLSRALGLPLDFFYEGLRLLDSNDPPSEPIDSINALASTRDGAEMMRTFAEASPLQRSIILDVAKSLVGGAKVTEPSNLSLLTPLSDTR